MTEFESTDVARAESQMLCETTARIERLIYIPAAVADPDHTPADFDEFVEDALNGSIQPLFRDLTVLAPYGDADMELPEPDEVAQLLRDEGVGGFLIEAATPVIVKGRGSWSMYHTNWLYAATGDTIAAAVEEWAQAKHASDIEKARDKIQ